MGIDKQICFLFDRETTTAKKQIGLSNKEAHKSVADPMYVFSILNEEAFMSSSHNKIVQI